jgi:iodotyrosine deiodinase
MNNEGFVTYEFSERSSDELIARSESFYREMDKRRSVRHFSTKPVPKAVIDNVIKTASTAPSGAHKQPWTFCVVTNKKLRSELRKLAEEEEFRSYNGRMSDEWLKDLEPLGTDFQKPFVEDAPYLIVVFKRVFEFENDEKHQNYYVNESVGIAVGFLLAAIHHAGLAALTHTPSPMNFLAEALERPKNERPFLVIPVGYPADGVVVPDLTRKTLETVCRYYD